jgi:hypothetical protein
LPDGAAELVDRSCAALVALRLQTGELPVIGDADSGQVVSFGPPSRDLRYLEVLLGHRSGGAAHLAVTSNSSVLSRGTEHFRKNSITDGITRVGPYLTLRKGQIDVAVRAGTHGLFGRATHDHDDNASPWVTLGPDDLLTEGGCFSYTRDARERERDIASASHNLLTVNGANRFAPFPGSISPSVARAPIAQAKQVWGANDELQLTLGWEDSVAGKVQHSRRIWFADDVSPALRVEDLVLMEREAPITMFWHFSPIWTLRHDASNEVVALASMTTPAVFCRVQDADLGALLSLSIDSYRYSPRYGEALQASVVKAHLAPAMRVHVITTFST